MIRQLLCVRLIWVYALREQGYRINLPPGIRPAFILVGMVITALLLSIAVRDGTPTVSADSLQTLPPALSGIPHQPALTDAAGPSLQNPVSPSLADFVIDSFTVGSPVVTGKTVGLSVNLKNNGNTPVGPYHLAFYFTADGGATRIAATTSDPTAGPFSAIQGGGSDSLAWELEVPGVDSLPVGGYDLCVQIQVTSAGTDTTETGNSKCEIVFVLPDMSADFPDEIRPMHYQSPVDEEWSIGNCVPRSVWEVLDKEVIPNLPAIVVPAYGAGLQVAEIVESATTSSTATPTEQETYWILMPHPYTKPAIMDDLHDGIHGPFEFGALSKYGNRVQSYKELALEIATREALSEEVYRLELQDGVEGTVNAVELVGMAADFSDALGLDLSADILGHHLQFLSNNHFFHDLATGAPLAIGAPVVDAFFSAAVRRTIEFETATETLTMLKQLPMDDAWSDGVDCASIELYRMMSADFMERWADELRKNSDEIAQAISLAVIKGTAKVGAKLILGKATVLAAPITLTVGLAVLSVYKLITHTEGFWSHVKLGTTAAQVYAHLYGYSHTDDHWDDLLKLEALQYTEFLFYRHLQAASTYSSDVISPLDSDRVNYPQSYRTHLAKRRDQELRKLLDTTWNPARDVNYLRGKVDYGQGAKHDLNGGIWSDGDTVWIAAEDADALFAYDLDEGLWDGGKIFNLGESLDSPFDSPWVHPDVLWADDTTMWVGAESYRNTLYGYRWTDQDGDDIEPTLELSIDTDGLNRRGIWSDGTTAWVAAHGWVGALGARKESKIYAYRLSDGTRVRNQDFDTLLKAGNYSPEGIWSDGQTMWVADADDGKVYAYDMESKKRDPRRDITAVAIPGIVDNGPLAGIWSNGETMWVLDATEDGEWQGEDKLFAYDMVSKPRNLDATLAPKDGIQQIALDWSRPSSDGGTDITGYIVQAAESGESWTTLMEDTGSTATRYTHTDTGGATTYRYRVAAISGVRLGFWSDVATVTTREGPKISSLHCWPRKVIVGQPVTCNPGVTGGLSSDYSYSWTANSGLQGNPIQDDERAFTTKWSSAGNPGINVIVCDTAMSASSGSRCASARQDITVLANTAPEIEIISPEEFLRVDAGVAQTFIFAANDPDKNLQSWDWYVDGERKGGEDSIYSEGLHSYHYLLVELRSFEYTFPAGDSYEVEVRFIDAEGAFGSAKWEVYAASESSPQAPTITDIIMTGDGSAFSTLWEPPDSTGGRTPTSYDLRYARRVDGASPSWTTVTGVWQTGFPLRTTVRNLPGGDARYDVQVRAVYSGTTGPWSATFIAAPQPEVLVTNFASEFAIEGSAPTDTTLDVRLLPPDLDYALPRLEITIFDEDGFSDRPGTESGSENSVLSPGSATIALPKDVWVDYPQATLEIYTNGRWITYSPLLERALVVAEVLLGDTGFLTGRSLMPGLFGVSRSLEVFQDWQDAGTGETGLDDVFGEDYLNCYHQVNRLWRVPVGLPNALLDALAGDFGLTKGVRFTIPASLDDDNYVSLAASFIASEDGRDDGESALLSVPDLMGTAEAPPSCQPPES